MGMRPLPEPGLRQHRATLGIVFLIVFIDLVGFGIVIPILPLYAETYRPSPFMFGLFMASFSFMQFIFAPILGRLSDRFGRRPVLLVSLIGSAVGYFMFGFAGSFGVLFASRIIDGISGGNISTAQAVIADITGPEDRAKGMGLVGAAFGLGFILGPAIGGLLVGIRPWLPGVAAAMASLVAFVLVMVRLPETRGEVSAHTVRPPFSLSSLAHALAHPFIGFCLVIVFLVIFAFANFETTFAQFATLRFEFSPRQVSFLFVYAGVLGAAVQGGLVAPLVRRFGEARLIIAGTALNVVALAFLPYSPRLGPLLGLLALLALGQGLVMPSLSSLTSKLVDHDEMGGTMGLYQSLASLGRVFGPFWGEVVYGAIGFAWPYRTGAVFMLLASGVAVLLLVRLRDAPSGQVPEGSTGT